MSFDASSFSVAPITYQQAKGLIAENHYIGKLGSTSVSLGLFEASDLVGAICFGTIPSNNAKSICGPEYATAVLELTRLALFERVPANAESWFIAHALKWLEANRADVKIILSYADSSVRHVGTIYQATNFLYTGSSGGDVSWLCDDGRKIHPRTTGWDQSLLPPGRWVPSPKKFRYVIFLGGPRTRKALRKALLWPSLPYPKLRDQ